MTIASWVLNTHVDGQILEKRRMRHTSACMLLRLKPLCHFTPLHLSEMGRILEFENMQSPTTSVVSVRKALIFTTSLNVNSVTIRMFIHHEFYSRIYCELPFKRSSMSAASSETDSKTRFVLRDTVLKCGTWSIIIFSLRLKHRKRLNCAIVSHLVLPSILK